VIPSNLTKIDPRRFELSSRLSLYSDEEGNIIFFVDRKSRFIMKDTKLFLERSAIVEYITGKPLQLMILSPICSKSLAALNEAKITVIQSQQ